MIVQNISEEGRTDMTFSCPTNQVDRAEKAMTEAKDRGEIRLEVEGDFLPPGIRLPMTLADGRWTAAWPEPPQRPYRYRFVADGKRRRIDPTAPRIEFDGDGAWSWSTSPDPEG